MKKILLILAFMASFSAKSQRLEKVLEDYFNQSCCRDTTTPTPTCIAPALNFVDSIIYRTTENIGTICATASGTAPYTFSVSPALPSGYTLNTSTGCVSGTHTGFYPLTAHTFNITNACGNANDIVYVRVDTPASVVACYSKTIQSDLFTAQSGFPAKVVQNGTGSLQETVYGVTYVTGAEADGQYSLRNGSNDLNGLTTSWAIAYNFAIKGSFTPFKIYSQTLNGTAGDTYKGAFWARERASGPKAIFSFKVYDGATLLASGNTGSIPTTYTNFKSSNFTMPSSGAVTIEVWSENNGTATGNDPLLDAVGLSRVTSTTTLYKKVTNNGFSTYYDSNNVVITGAALTQLQTDIANGTASKISCTF
jgi:hypothetical protein